jgi:transcriptional regulator with XRE-family HTH domain
MARGQSFEDFLAEETAGNDELAAVLDDAFVDMRLAVQLAMARNEANMSQQALSLASGVSQPMISRIENGDQQPTWPTIMRLLHALGAELLAGPDDTVSFRVGRTPVPQKPEAPISVASRSDSTV